MNLITFILTAGGLPPDVQQIWTLKTWIAIIAAVLLWLSFVFLGLAARNFGKVLRKVTEWQFLIIAPSGIIIYAIIQASQLISEGKYRLTGTIGYIAYGLFFISSVITVIGIFRFYRILSPKKKKVRRKKENKNG